MVIFYSNVVNAQCWGLPVETGECETTHSLDLWLRVYFMAIRNTTFILLFAVSAPSDYMKRDISFLVNNFTLSFLV